jgi:hypothetical protein
MDEARSSLSISLTDAGNTDDMKRWADNKYLLRPDNIEINPRTIISLLEKLELLKEENNEIIAA